MSVTPLSRLPPDALQDWVHFTNKVAEHLNKLLVALEQPQSAAPAPRYPGFGGSAKQAAPGGGGAAPRAQQQQQPANPAAAAAAAACGEQQDDISQSTEDGAGARGSPSKPSGAVHQAAAGSDATPRSAGGSGRKTAAATAYTNPLTTQGAAGGSGSKPTAAAKPASATKPRKAPLPLQPSSGERLLDWAGALVCAGTLIPCCLLNTATAETITNK